MFSHSLDPQLTVADPNEHAQERSVAQCWAPGASTRIALNFDQVGHVGKDLCRRGGGGYLLLMYQYGKMRLRNYVSMSKASSDNQLLTM